MQGESSPTEEPEEMFEKLRSLLFEPHYPQRYIGRHRIRRHRAAHA